jgi:hypothetical protein
MPGLLPRGEVGETGEGQQHRAESTARGDAPSRGWAKRGFRGGEEGGKRGGATKRAEVASRKPRGRSPGGSRGQEFRIGGDLAVGWASVARARRYKPLFVRGRARMTTGFEGSCIPPSRVARLLKPVRLRPPRALLGGRSSALRPAKLFLRGPLHDIMACHSLMIQFHGHDSIPAFRRHPSRSASSRPRTG